VLSPDDLSRERYHRIFDFRTTPDLSFLDKEREDSNRSIPTGNNKGLRRLPQPLNCFDSDRLSYSRSWVSALTP
jgi:hypothetical protein